MGIAFDPTKDAANQVKHGVSLAFAKNVDWSNMWFFVDDRADYLALREIGQLDRGPCVLRGLHAARQHDAHHQPAQG